MKKFTLHNLPFLLFTILFFNACVPDTGDNDEDRIRSTLYTEAETSITCEGTSEIATIVTVIDRGEGTGTMTWTNDKTWVLQGVVYVESGQTLTIEPGTVIKGSSGEGSSASTLIVARGAKIIAEGTAELPIIFTTSEDHIYSNKENTCNESGFSAESKGLWGGLVILGNAPITKASGESVLDVMGKSHTRALYGGNDQNDNSGSLRYVSIRHTGTLSPQAINFAGLTMAGVGAETTIEYVEVIASEGDGFQWKGGTVNTSYLLSTFITDDAIDYSEGWQGKNQFLLAYSGKNSDHASENKGGHKDCRDCQPYSTPTFSNTTFIGSRQNNAVSYRKSGAGSFYNSIFVNFKNGFDLEYIDAETDAYSHFVNENIIFKHNILENIAGNPVIIVNESNEDVSGQQETLEAYFNSNNTLGEAGLENLVPAVGSAADSPGEQLSDNFFQDVNYRGAFAPTEEPWYIGWTKFEEEF